MYSSSLPIARVYRIKIIFFIDKQKLKTEKSAAALKEEEFAHSDVLSATVTQRVLAEEEELNVNYFWAISIPYISSLLPLS